MGNINVKTDIQWMWARRWRCGTVRGYPSVTRRISMSGGPWARDILISLPTFILCLFSHWYSHFIFAFSSRHFSLPLMHFTRAMCALIVIKCVFFLSSHMACPAAHAYSVFTNKLCFKLKAVSSRTPFSFPLSLPLSLSLARWHKRVCCIVVLQHCQSWRLQ